MRLTIIGSGNAIPRPDCRPTSLWLDISPDVQVRIDCGSGCVHSTPRHGLDWQAQTHQLITHFHLDHIGDLTMLLFAFRYGREPVQRGPLALIGPPGFADLLQRLEAVTSPSVLKQEFELRVEEMAAGATAELAPGVKVKSAATQHTPEALAYRIDANGRSFGFTGDAVPAAESDLAVLFERVDVLVAECSHVEARPDSPHLTVGSVASLAAAAGARHLVVTHPYFDPTAEKLAEKLAAVFDGHVTVGYDGLSLTV